MRVHTKSRKRKNNPIKVLTIAAILLLATAILTSELVHLSQSEISSTGVRKDKQLFAAEQAGDKKVEVVGQKVDSVTIREWLIDEQIAYGRILFGMRESEVKRLSEGALQKIGDFKYQLLPAYTSQGRLFSLQITGTSAPAGLFDSQVKQSWQNLKSLLESKYGSSKESRPYPYFLDMQNGAYQFTDRWNIESKKISLGVLENKSRYSAVVIITDKDMETAVKRQEGKKSQQAVDTKAERF